MPPALHTYTVTPTLPESLAGLRELAHNLRWAWHHETRTLFRAFGGEELWHRCGHNPARVIGEVPQERVAAAAADPVFLERYHAVLAEHRDYLEASTWWSEGP
ncbi:MAG: DUF3417 domain-containing protein, partial [Armatimonadota bacterium]